MANIINITNDTTAITLDRTYKQIFKLQYLVQAEKVVLRADREAGYKVSNHSVEELAEYVEQNVLPIIDEAQDFDILVYGGIKYVVFYCTSTSQTIKRCRVAMFEHFDKLVEVGLRYRHYYHTVEQMFYKAANAIKKAAVAAVQTQKQQQKPVARREYNTLADKLETAETAIAELTQKMTEATQIINEQMKAIISLKEENEVLTKENAELKAQLAALTPQVPAAVDNTEPPPVSEEDNSPFAYRPTEAVDEDEEMKAEEPRLGW